MSGKPPSGFDPTKRRDTKENTDAKPSQSGGTKSVDQLTRMMDESARITRLQQEQQTRDKTLDVDTDHLRDLRKHLDDKQKDPSRNPILDVDLDHLNNLTEHLDKKQEDRSS